MQVLTAAAVLAAVAWVYLLTGHGGYWRTGQRLPRPGRMGGERRDRLRDGRCGGAGRHAAAAARWPSVVAIVPARDEAEMLPLTLPSLLGQDYQGPMRVVLVDDGSRDGTAGTAAALASRAGGRLRLVGGVPAPVGWAGKVWAMEQGVRAAGDCDYLLFTDADITHQQGTLTALTQAALADRRDLVSQMALLRAGNAPERLLVPAFVYFFAMLYPFRRVNRNGGRTAAAAGGCMLVRRKALADAGGLRQIRGALIDDVALGRLLKRAAGGRCWLGFSTSVLSRRAYPRLADVWQMVARSAYHQLRYSPALLVCTIGGLAWLYVVPPVALLTGLTAGLTAARAGAPPAWWCAAAGLAGWLIMAVTYLPVLRLYRLSPLRAAGLPLIALMFAAMTLDSARLHRAGRGGAWKGRTVGRTARAAGKKGRTAVSRTASAAGKGRTAVSRTASSAGTGRTDLTPGGTGKGRLGDLTPGGTGKGGTADGIEAAPPAVRPPEAVRNDP